MKTSNDFSLCLCGSVVKNVRIRQMACPHKTFHARNSDRSAQCPDGKSQGHGCIRHGPL